MTTFFIGLTQCEHKNYLQKQQMVFVNFERAMEGLGGVWPQAEAGLAGDLWRGFP